MTEKDYQREVKELKKVPGIKTVENLLRPKTIYGMFKWVKEHADYLIYFQNYNKVKIISIMNGYSKTIGVLATSGMPDAHEDSINLSLATVYELEVNCK